MSECGVSCSMGLSETTTQNSSFNNKMNNNSKYNYKVRFHLAKGDNYMKWQVRDINDPDGSPRYYSPDDTRLLMLDCKLGNKPSISQKIFQGENKTVCAWVWCKSVWPMPGPATRVGKQCRYNPRINPHWHTQDETNVDNCEIDKLVTLGRGIFKAA